ncbi:MAG: hypothetical protein AAFV29_25880, partial [Myxococcota bacterium]
MGWAGSSLLVLLVANTPTGHLHVLTPKGTVINVDGRLSARASDDDGIVVRNLKPGLHRALLLRKDLKPQAFVVTIRLGEVTVLRPNAWIPSRPVRTLETTDEQHMVDRPWVGRPIKVSAPSITPTSRKETPTRGAGARATAHRSSHAAEPSRAKEAVERGQFVLAALPIGITVKSEALGWQEISVRTMLQTEVPVGSHRITVCNDYRCTDHRIHIDSGRLKSVLVDMDRGTLDDVSAVHARRWQRARQACA